MRLRLSHAHDLSNVDLANRIVLHRLVRSDDAGVNHNS